MSEPLSDLSHVARCFLTTLMLLQTPATDLLLSPSGDQIRQRDCRGKAGKEVSLREVNTSEGAENSKNKKAQRQKMYELRYSINWHMYLF